MKQFITSGLLLLSCCTGFSNVRLPKIFGDNMVLQRGQVIPVWGWADPKEKVTIQLNKQTKTVTADKTGSWRIDFASEMAGGPYQLIIKGKNSLTFSNVLIGDVWICSGQSNMEWILKNTIDADKEIQQANYPQLRHIEVTKAVASEPQSDIKGGQWNICSPATAANFTAVGYYFAKDLQKELNIPIGLIHTSWGGTHVETWTSKEAFENTPEFKQMIQGMPTLNLDSLAKQKNAAMVKSIAALQGTFNESGVNVEGWKTQAQDDSKWPAINIPGLWEQQALGDFDGVVWLRKTIEVKADDAGKEAVLDLSTIDDADETYLNGVKIGSTVGYNEKRRYNIPAGILKAGKNTIAVRVTDTGGGGGIYGEAADVKITIGGAPLSLAGEWKFQVESLLPGNVNVGPNSYPTLLFNAMLNPLIPYGIKGAIWYQGESNAGRAVQYSRSFPLMITDWRKRWKEGDFPFYFVQLSNFASDNGNSAKGSTWAELREAQTATLSLPNTGMAVTTDIGNPTDIHPRNKQDVGKRLAAAALNKTYGKQIVYSGPVYQSMQVTGNKATLSFTETGSGLMTKSKYGYLGGFEVAGADQKFYYAKAFIEGNKVVVYSDEVATPVAVRFGWSDETTDDNLFNKEGFPAGPFRTDKWKRITETNVYEIGR